jgi:hypothetical protein
MIKPVLFFKADLQVKIAEEQSRNDGIHGIVVSMDNGDGMFCSSCYALETVLTYKICKECAT